MAQAAVAAKRQSVTEEKRVLSVQSHVVSGYAGNKSAVFPLQLLGFEVDYLNTVQFSNHTGYGRFKGMRFDADHLEDIFSALDDNGLLKQSHLLTGYTPSAKALETVSRAVDRLKEINPDLVYVCDTVCGDDGRLYVAQEVIPIYKQLIAKASVITPNQFEAEIFSETKIGSLASLRAALATFHTVYNLPSVLISSLSLPRAEVEAAGIGLPADCRGEDFLICAGSSRPASSEPAKSFVITFPRLEEHYEGVGDVFSSLVCAHLSPATSTSPISPLAHTAEHAIASLSGVILNTRDHAYQAVARDASNIGLVPSADETADHRMHRLGYVELRLVQSAQHILHPTIVHKAQPLMSQSKFFSQKATASAKKARKDENTHVAPVVSGALKIGRSFPDLYHQDDLFNHHTFFRVIGAYGSLCGKHNIIY